MSLERRYSRQPTLSEPARKLLDEHAARINIRCDRMFAGLFILQWIGGIICALVISPRTWIGATSSIHLHVWASVFLGAAVISLPLWLIATRPGKVGTRHAIAVAQCLYSSLLIHLSGGRIETHFHIFGSLAFLAFYRDWRVLVTATIVVATDHLLRGLYWSESVFGIVNAGHFRWMEHAGWVIFEDVFLVMSCVQGRREMAEIARQQSDTVEQGNLRSAKLTMALSDQQDLLSAMDAGICVCTTDPQGLVLTANDQFCLTTGYSREQLIGTPVRAMCVGCNDQQVMTNMNSAISRGATWHGEVCHRAADGHLVWLSMTIRGMLGADGQVQRVIGVSTDVTDRKSAELHLQQAHKLESIGQLAAGISHEINTPAQYVGDNVRFLRTQFSSLMAVIHKYADQINPDGTPRRWADRCSEIEKTLQTLDYGFLREEIPRAIDESIEGLDRVSAIIAAMKDFSHPGSSLKEAADLNRSIQSTIEVCRNRWKYVAELTADLSPELPAVPCLIAEFNQVILNLIVNAADAIGDACGAGGLKKGHIWVSTMLVTTAAGNAAEIRVRDNGPGIPLHARQRIFEPFFTTKPVGKGTGQGLTLSRNVIVAKHGGEMFFETEEGVGTTFVVRLPLSDPSQSLQEAA